ncbi:hypothetical protein ScPMuIL_000788 [Solemya velum]
MSRKNDEPSSKAAIAGLACRFPKSHNVEEFWENLLAGVDMIGPTRWPEGLYGLPPRVGLIPDINKFDSNFFDFSDLEVNNMNPMLMHLLEVTYECVVDSGLLLQDLQKSRTGFYLACFLSDFDAVETSRCLTSSRLSIASCLAGCVTQWFGFRGPMITVDTACSSSLSALHIAVIDLMTRKCDFAVVAGVNIILNPVWVQQMLYLNMLSPQGQSRVFDKEANGYVRAEGVASILLARSPDICHRVYASVVNIDVNCDGYVSEGITFPNQDAQSELLKKVYDDCGLTGDDLAYIEGHSTGTQAGDRVEMGGLRVLYEHRKLPLLMGAVKSNMGHTEATAGLAGLLKCILIAHHQVIPPNRNFKEMNPKIDALVTGKVKVVDKVLPLPDGYIGINSFGFGGVNGHLVMKPFYRKSKHKEDNTSVLIPLMLRHLEAIPFVQRFLSKHADDSDFLHMMSQSMVSCDHRQTVRAYYVTGPGCNVRFVRTGYLADTPGTELPPSLWIVIDDLLLDNINVSASILHNKCFYKSIDMSQQILSRLDPEIKLFDIIAMKTDIVPGSTDWLCVAIAVLLGLVDCLMAVGIEVCGVVGGGLSEIVAAYLDFCLDRTQCIQLAYLIGKTVSENRTGRKVQLYHVHLQSAEAFKLGPKVQVLAVLSDESFVIAVSVLHLEKVLKNIHWKGGHYRLLAADFPIYSSSSFNAEKLRPELKNIIPSPKPMSVRMLSGKVGLNEENIDAAYIAGLLNTRVDMSSAMEIISLESCLLHLSLGPSTSAPKSPQKQRWDQTPNWHEHTLFCHASLESLYNTLGEVHLLGHDIDQSKFFDIEYPLGCETASMGPLVHWDHSVSWHLPDWPEFSCKVKDDKHHPYTVFGLDQEGIHMPVATIIYHAWAAICQKLQPSEDGTLLPVVLFNLITHGDTSLEQANLTGSFIQIHWGRKQFTVIHEDVLLLSGRFKESPDGLDLPRVPGYDLDINQNNDADQYDYIIEKTEILWEDSWLDFLSAVLEFTSQFMEGGIQQISIDPEHHAEEVKDCANILTVIEIYTGVCKAGSIVCQFYPQRLGYLSILFHNNHSITSVMLTHW